METPELKPTMGVGGAIFTLVGMVVGVAPFVMTGDIASQTGPAVSVSYLIAGVLAAFSCVVAARIGALFPISGAGYVGASCVLSPFFGFLLVWLVMACMGLGMPILGLGFAEYLEYFAPGLPRPAVAAAAIVLFGAVNLTGVRATVAVQALLVTAMLLVLVVFGAGGLAHMDPALARPFAPNGWSAVLVGAIPAYYAFGGFMALVEMGDEIENPSRTVPIALGVSFLIVLALYLVVAVALPGLLPWDTLEGSPATLARASEVFLPKWFSGFIALSAMLGAGVNINAWFLTQTRDIYAMARDGILPATLAHVNERRGEPDRAILLAIAIAAGGLLLGARVREYAITLVLAMTSLQIFAGFVILLAPSRVPDLDARSTMRLGRAGRIVVGGGFSLMSAVFWLAGASQSPRGTVVFFGIVAAGGLYYALRRRALRRQGRSIEEMLTKDLARLR